MNIGELQHWLIDPWRRPLVMGVLNVTPDSFSDGGHYLQPAAAAARAREMIEQGADWIDVGGESTRPGSEPVSTDEQLRRVLPVIEALRPMGVVVSVDTSSAAVARATLSAGASIINDVTAGRGDPDMPAAMSAAEAIILMHSRGTPKTMQKRTKYDNLVADVRVELLDHFQNILHAATAAGSSIDANCILLDPGIGFAKTTAQNLTLLRELRSVQVGKLKYVVGTSRKRFIGEITNEPVAENRLFGTAATVAWAVANGASVVRVHDVRAMRQVVDMTRAITSD